MQAANQAIKSGAGDLSKSNFRGAVATESVKPIENSQGSPVFTQAESNQRKQEGAGKEEANSVLDMVRAKLAERPIVVFDRESKNSSASDFASGSANYCEAVVSKEDQTDELVATYAQHLRRVLSGSGRKP